AGNSSMMAATSHARGPCRASWKTGLASIAAGAPSVDQHIVGTAVGTARGAGFLHRNEYTRVGIPQAHARHRAMQRKVLAGDFITILRVRLDGACRRCLDFHHGEATLADQAGGRRPVTGRV